MKVSCPNSPTGSHASVVDKCNCEKCRYCGRVKQNPIEDLQPVYFYNMRLFTVPSRDTFLAMQSQRSELAKYFC